MRRRVGCALVAPLALLAAAIALLALRGAAAGYPEDLPRALPRPGFLAGAYHVHSTASDGRGSIEEIAGAARSVGLDFVLVTDHNVAPRAPEFVDGVLMIFAVELSTAHGHVVALGLKSEVPAEERGPGVLSAIGRRGGAAVLAHPVQRRNPWRSWEGSPLVAGLELYSADTMLREALESPLSILLPAAAAWLTHPTHGLMSLAAPQEATTARLLQLASVRPTVALCSHDAHGFPHYSEVFRVMATFVPVEPGFQLPSDPAVAARKVEEAILSGETLCVFRALGPPDGFALQGAEGRRLRRGADLRIRPPTRSPEATELRLRGTGRKVSAWTVRAEGPGAVQVEVWRQAPGRWGGSEWRPWIVPSPVQILE